MNNAHNGASQRGTVRPHVRQPSSLFRLGVPSILCVVVILFFVFVIRAFTAESVEKLPETGQPENNVNEAEVIQEVDTSEVQESFSIDEAALRNFMGNELAEKLFERAKTNEDVSWIAAHPDALGVDGPKVKYKLLKLAAVEPSATRYIRDFQECYPQETAPASGADDDRVGRTPRLYQWDQRWAYTVYSSTTFGLAGCAPTTMAMVYQGLTGKTDMNPYDMGQLAKKNGYMAQYAGTDGSFLVNIAPKLGLRSFDVSANAASIKEVLARNDLIVCNVGPGDFTEGGHFFLITGMDSEGKLTIHDPFSAERSNQTWEIGRILSQTRKLYGFSL